MRTGSGEDRVASHGGPGRTAMAGIVGLLLWVGGCTGAQPPDEVAPEEVPTTAATVAEEAAVPEPFTRDPAPTTAMVEVAERKDGDSFVGTDGVEYRVGLINTPELSACGGAEAAERSYALLADGFVPQPYTTDQYDRAVARIAVPDGDLGVILAAEGLADDRYLEEFRHEHPAYAEELDAAFAEARRENRGLWASCWDQAATAETPVPVQPLVPNSGGGHGGRVGIWECHAAYHECLPVGPDLDCADVGHSVALTGNADPYRLDGNSTTRTDGTGCDSYEPWSPGASYPYYR